MLTNLDVRKGWKPAQDPILLEIFIFGRWEVANNIDSQHRVWFEAVARELLSKTPDTYVRLHNFVRASYRDKE